MPFTSVATDGFVMEAGTTPTVFVDNPSPQQPNIALLNFQLVYLGFICFAGAFGNIMVLAASFVQKELRTPANLFLINLGFVDLVTNIMSIPVLMISLKYNDWIFSDGLCHATAYISIICLGQSVQTLAHIAGARYLLITKPQKVYQRFCSWKAVSVNIIFIWCATILIVIMPEYGLGDIIYNPAFGLCSIDQQSDYSWIYTTVLVCHSIVSTFFLIPCFYFLTCYKVMSSRKRIHQRTAFQHNRSRIEENFDFWKREIGLSKVLIVTLLAYIICWVPFAVIHFFNFNNDISFAAHRVSVLLLVTNSCINPYIYAVLNRKFRKVYVTIFSGLWYKVRPPSTSESNASPVAKEDEQSNINIGILVLQQHTDSASSSHDNQVFQVMGSDA
nr:melatonin receptor type 1B-B-like [Lytechinus pictus]